MTNTVHVTNQAVNNLQFRKQIDTVNYTSSELSNKFILLQLIREQKSYFHNYRLFDCVKRPYFEVQKYFIA